MNLCIDDSKYMFGYKNINNNFACIMMICHINLYLARLCIIISIFMIIISSYSSRVWSNGKIYSILPHDDFSYNCYSYNTCTNKIRLSFSGKIDHYTRFTDMLNDIINIKR